MPDKLIINAALTGMVPTKAENPHVPITPEEIAISIVAELIARRRNSPTPLPHMKSAKAVDMLK